MANPDIVARTAPFRLALAGTVLLAIGGMLFVNLNEDPETFMRGVLTVRE